MRMQTIESSTEITPETKERIENHGFTKAELAELEDWGSQETRGTKATRIPPYWAFVNN